MLYHMVDMRRQVLVQLDDSLVDELDLIAARLEVSRSNLIRQAVAGWLEAHAAFEADRELMAAYRRLPQDPDLVEAAAKLAAVTFPAP